MTKNFKILIVFLVLISLIFTFGVLFYPYSAVIPTGASLEAPTSIHLLGTDDLGIDIFAQLSKGYFYSISIGASATVLTFLLGGSVGIANGLLEGSVKMLLSFLINIFLSIPKLPIMIVLGAFLGQSRWNIILIVSFFSWAPIAKIISSQTEKIKSRGYIRLAKSYGGNVYYIFKKHMQGEILPLLFITSLGVMGTAIIEEASLAYLGLCDPLSKSWGLMINKCLAFRGIYFTDYWKWWLVPPVIALIITVVCLRLLSKELEKRWI